ELLAGPGQHEIGCSAGGALELAVDHDPTQRLDLPLGHLDAGNPLDLVDDRLGQRPGLIAVVAGERGLLGEDDVDLLVALGEDRVEGVRDLVADDERARDHRRAQHDREHCQDRAKLAAHQAAQDHTGHCPLTSFMAWSTSAELVSCSSRTLRPSARNRILSAIAAARESWVTITVVWP